MPKVSIRLPEGMADRADTIASDPAARRLPELATMTSVTRSDVLREAQQIGLRDMERRLARVPTEAALMTE